MTKIIDSHFTAFWGVFLNLGCNLRCDYCIQKVSQAQRPVAGYSLRPGRDWVQALNAIEGRRKPRFLRRARVKKLSILGGEPTIYPDFLYVLDNLDSSWKITVTSNFDSPFFEREAELLQGLKGKRRLRFNGSLHFLYTPVEKFIANVRKVQKAGVDVHTLFVVLHPAYQDQAQACKRQLLQVHRRVKLQRFLGFYNGQLYPQADEPGLEKEQKDGIRNYPLYQQAFGQRQAARILCHSDKVLIAPNGDIYNCHYKVYTNHKDKLGNLFDQELRVEIPREYFLCAEFGFCNPCDSEGHLFRTLAGKVESIAGG